MEQPSYQTEPSSEAATGSEARHTPGPWRVGREIGESQLMPRIEILRDVTAVEGVRPTTYYLAEVCYPTTTGNTVGAEERRANARLIASSPRMYDYVAARAKGGDTEAAAILESIHA